MVWNKRVHPGIIYYRAANNEHTIDLTSIRASGSLPHFKAHVCHCKALSLSARASPLRVLGFVLAMKV